MKKDFLPTLVFLSCDRFQRFPIASPACGQNSNNNSLISMAAVLRTRSQLLRQTEETAFFSPRDAVYARNSLNGRLHMHASWPYPRLKEV